jgi:sulfate permease, SulP family
VSQTTTVSIVTPEYIREGQAHILQDKDVPAYVSILRIHGPFLFGTTDKLVGETADLNVFAPIVVLRLRNMTAIDATGLHAFEVFSDRLKRAGKSLILCGACHQPARIMRQVEFVAHIGRNNIVPSVQSALTRARELNNKFDRPRTFPSRDCEGAALTPRG